jgi:hypothetical protein
VSAHYDYPSGYAAAFLRWDINNVAYSGKIVRSGKYVSASKTRINTGVLAGFGPALYVIFKGCTYIKGFSKICRKLNR